MTNMYAILAYAVGTANRSESRREITKHLPLGCYPAPTSLLRIGLLVFISSVAGMVQPAAVQAELQDGVDFKAQFLRLCDIACKELNKEFSPFGDRDNTDPRTHHIPFFEDGHAIRALAVAYDMTGKQEYLDTCKHWSDRMITYQAKMIPPGAYYLNQPGTRKPGEASGDWYISDAGSVGMGVFATAVRCPDKNDKARYLDSAESFAKVVMADRIGPNGGIIEEIGWHGDFRDEWWCSTATFGTLALQLYEETGKEEYRRVGLGALRWMIGRDFRDAKVIEFHQRASGVIFYDFELYVMGMKYLPDGSEERKAAMAQIAEALKWMAANQIGRGGKPSWRYLDDSNEGNTDMAALPFLMYAFADQLPEYRDLVPEADKELSYIGGLLLDKGDPLASRLTVWELMSWGMMSYAEKLSPGSLFRTSAANHN